MSGEDTSMYIFEGLEDLIPFCNSPILLIEHYCLMANVTESNEQWFVCRIFFLHFNAKGDHLLNINNATRDSNISLLTKVAVSYVSVKKKKNY